jgi:DNA replication and repair protein RecF
MHLTDLSLTNYRNYARLKLTLPRQVVILCGENAQGKSNFLEAIYYLVTSRSPRASADRQLISWLAEEEVLPYARLEGRFERRDTACHVAMVLMREHGEGTGEPRLRRQIELDGVRKKAMEYLGELLVVMFSPRDIDLVNGPPDGRRRFLDIALCQLDSRYLHSLRRYTAVLGQRNSLLRRLRQGHGSRQELEIWDEQLASPGAYLMLRRSEIIRGLSRLGQPFHRRLTADQGRMELAYVPSFDPTHKPSVNYQLPMRMDVLRARQEAWSGLDDSALDAAFRAQLGDIRQQEIERGRTLIGPQRDDVQFLENGVSMTTFGSRGQQRTIALSLRLAERALMLEERGEEPILLLDDVMSELDAARREALTALLDRSGQAILTTTSWTEYQPLFLASAHCLSVAAGRITPDRAPMIMPLKSRTAP